MPETLSLAFTTTLWTRYVIIFTLYKQNMRLIKEEMICPNSHVYYEGLKFFSGCSGYTALKLQEKNNYSTF